MVNFDQVAFLDFSLAKFVLSGLPHKLKALVNNFQLMLKDPFSYGDFESWVQTFYNGLPRQTTTCNCQGTVPPQQTTPSTGKITKDEVIWHIHMFLDSQSRCHYFKKTCGSVPGTCPGPIDRAYINILDTFVAPPKPAAYKLPKASSGPASTPLAGRTTQAPAGQPANCSTTVAGIEEVALYPDLDVASVAAFQEIDEELCLA
jgi:hypothetical protein